MDPELAQIFEFIGQLAPTLAIIITVIVAGWVVTTWMRIKNGYPLQSSWGTPLHPTTDKESQERIKLLTNENVQLRAEIGSMKDRLETMERIVTDEPSRLAAEIDSLGKRETEGNA